MEELRIFVKRVVAAFLWPMKKILFTQILASFAKLSWTVESIMARLVTIFT